MHNVGVDNKEAGSPDLILELVYWVAEWHKISIFVAHFRMRVFLTTITIE